LISSPPGAGAGGGGGAAARGRAPAAPTDGLEVEVDDLAQLEEALAAGVTAVLLDNMDLEMVRRAVESVAARATVEVSGGVRLEDVRALAEAGVDVISVGALTTQSPWIDLSLVVE